jgi:hypothetical protein
LKHHAIGLFNLAIARGVGDRGLVDVDGVFLAEIPKDGVDECFAKVGEDPFGHAKAMLDVSDEFDYFF